MSELTYAVASKILADTLAFCREKKFNPMAVVILDAAGGLKAAYPDIRERDVYLCGSPSMMARVERSLHVGEDGCASACVHVDVYQHLLGGAE